MALKRLLVALLSLWGSVSFAQNPLLGLVLNEKTKEPVPFALIEFGHAHQRIIADTAGRFELNVHETEFHLHIQAIGYQHFHAEVELQSDTLIAYLIPDNYLIQEVTVSVERKSAATSQSSTTVLTDRSELAQNWSPSLAQTLSFIPGVNSINTGVGIGKPVIRGLSGSRIQVNDNGIKQEGQQWGADHGLDIDPFSVEEIEIIKGANALAYGSDATGGILNLRPATLPDEKFSSSANALYQSVNNAFGASASSTIKNESTWLTLRLSGQSFGDYKVPADTFIYNSFILPIENEQLVNTAGHQYSGQLTTGLSAGKHDFSARMSYFEQKVGIFPGAVGIPRAYQIADDGDRRNIALPFQHNKHVRFSGHHHYHGENFQWITDLGFQNNDREEQSFPDAHGITPDEDNTQALALDLSTASLNSRTYFYSGSNKLQVGIQGEFQRNEIGGFEFLIPEYRRTLGGLYFLNEKSTKRGSINYGVRTDVVHYNAEPFFQPIYDIVNDEIVKVDSRQRSYAAAQYNFGLSAAFGWMHHWSDQWVSRMNIARTFRAPNIAELAANGVHHGTFRHEVGSWENTPEVGYQLDVEITHSRRNWQFQVSPFFNYFTNFIFLRPSAQFSPLPEAGQLYIYEQAPAIHSGTEAQVTWLPNATEKVSVGLDYIYAFNLDENLPLPFMPPLSGLISWEKEWHLHFLGTEDWKTDFGYRYTAPQNNVDRNELTTPGYSLLHLAVGNEWNLNSGTLGLRLEVRNALNNTYLNHLSRYRFLNLPEPGRNITAQLYWRL